MKLRVPGGGHEEGLHAKGLLPHAPEPCQGFLQEAVLKTTIASLPDLFLTRYMYKLYKETRNRSPVPLAERTLLDGYEKVSPFLVSTCGLGYLLYRALVQQEECSGHVLIWPPVPWLVPQCEHQAMHGHRHHLAGWIQEP